MSRFGFLDWSLVRRARQRNRRQPIARLVPASRNRRLTIEPLETRALLAADIDVTMSDSPDPVIAGQNITYTVTVSNSGPDAATNVVLTDAVPAGTSFVVGTVSQGTINESAGVVTASLGTINASSSATFTLVVTVNPNVADGAIVTNTATATSATDVTPANNSDTEGTQVIAQADVSVTKTDSPDPVVAGSDLTYTLTVANSGPSDAQNVVLSDSIPVGTSAVSFAQNSGPSAALAFTGTSFTASFDTLAAGATATFTMVVTVNPNTLNGSPITNFLEVTSTTTDPNLANNSDVENTTAITLADLTVVKIDSPDPVVAGTNLGYSITLTNNGPSNAQNVLLEDFIPAGTSASSFSQTSGPAASLAFTGSSFTATFGTLAAGATATFEMAVTVDPASLEGAIIANTVDVTTATTDPNLANNSDTELTTVAAPQADLVVTKTDSADPAVIGEQLEYTITLTNIGPSDAQNLVLTDIFPPETSPVFFIQTSGPAASGVSFDGDSFDATFTTLAAGATATFLMRLTVDASTPDNTTVTNSVTVTTATTDPNLANNADVETTLVLLPRADLSVTKSDTPDPVQAGNNVEYTITLTNAGPSDAQNVVLTDVFPVGTTPIFFIQTAGPAATSTSFTGVSFLANFTSLAAGATATFLMRVQVDAATLNGTIYTNATNVTTTTLDPNPANNSDTETTTVGTVDLSVTKTDSPDPVIAGNNLTYTVTVQNTGTVAAQNVQVFDATPPGTTFFSATQTSGPAFTLTTPALGGTGQIEADASSLAPGAIATFTFVVNVIASVPGGVTITNSVNVASSSTDLNPANNVDTENTTVNTQADLEVDKTGSPDPVVAGTNVTYTLTVSNTGPSDSNTVTLVDLVPAGSTFVSFAQTGGPAFTLTTPPVGGTGSVDATAATLAAGATATFVLVVNVNANIADGSEFANTATVTSITTDVDPGNNSSTTTATVQAQADLVITKTDTPDPVNAGEDLTYTVTVTNNGPSDATSVTVEDLLPAGTSFVSFMQTSGPAFTLTTPPVGGTGSVDATAATLAAGASATFSLVVNVDDGTGGTLISNTASVTTTTTDPNLANNSATETTLVPLADLVITKSDSADPVQAGDNITYTLTVTNNGPNDAQNVTAFDLVPANTTFAGFLSITQGSASFSAATNDINAVFGTIPAGGSATLTFVVAVDAGLPNPSIISNTATTASDADDPNLDNNSVTQFTVVGTLGGAGLADDPENPGQKVLLVVGTNANDVLIIEPRPSNLLQVRVKNTGQLLGIFSRNAFARILALGLGGHDLIFVDPRIAKPAELHGNEGNDKLIGGKGPDELFGEEGIDVLQGGLGNDTLRGGSGDDVLVGGSGRDFLYGEGGNDVLKGDAGNDVLLGGAGNDFLYGGIGRDLLIGGAGRDRLFGQDGDDILIGGTTTHDDDAAALLAILAEWGAAIGFNARIAGLSAELNSSTVLDDGVVDELTGGLNRDWYLDFALADTRIGFSSNATTGDRRN